MENDRLSTKEFIALVSRIEAAYREAGIDVEKIKRTALAKSAEMGQNLANRLLKSVLPIFVANKHGQPARIGSCVLVRVDSDFYAFTAGHVLRDAGTSPLWALSALKGKFLPLPYISRFHTEHLDVGVVPLRASALGDWVEYVFLTGSSEIDEDDLPDTDSFLTFYYVFGYPASRTQFKIHHKPQPRVRQRAFQLKTSPPDAVAYSRETLPQLDYLLLEYNQKKTRVQGKVIAPPKLEGVSGGGIFHISRTKVDGPLVAIATEHRQQRKLIVSTRIKHFLRLARHLRATERAELFE
jgi:hypothetical protein